MEKLPKDVARYLKMLKPHDRDLSYFTKRFRDMDFENVCKEVTYIRSLERHSMIVASTEKVTKTVETDDPTFIAPNGREYPVIESTKSIDYPTGFMLTADGQAYHSEMVKEAIEHGAASVLTAILGGFFAWLFVFWLG